MQRVRVYSFARALVTVLLTAAVTVLSAGCGSADHSEQIEQHKVLAGELDNNRLYQAAVKEYEKVLSYDDLTSSERANINYLIARLYYEDLKDYRNAAAYYIRAREYDPEGSFAAEASKNLVASLEKLGNVFDARRQLSAATNVDSKPRSKDDVAVAEIGGRKVWRSEIEDHIAALPPQVQDQLTSRQARVEFLHQFVGVELLYNAAVREDYLSDPEIQRQQENMLRRLLVDRFVSEKVIPRIQVDTLDVKNYYLANKGTRYGDKPYDSVRSEVFLDYQSDKAEAAYSDYIESLARAENVKFYEQNLE